MSSNPSSETPLFKRTNASDSTKSNFTVNLRNTTLTIKAGNESVTSSLVMTVSDQFPMQKWVYLVINVFSTGTVEAYMNGRLVKTVSVKSMDIKPSSIAPLTVGSTALNGYVTKFTRLPDTLDAQTVQNNYYAGNGISNVFSSLVPYGMNLTISKGEDVQRSIKVF